ncbi:MAG TPA: signal peptidase II, partial [Gemmatimonadaceae bacterium]|nr:signal peptidase II [Gemmatimonadaceae bacterium]
MPFSRRLTTPLSSTGTFLAVTILVAAGDALSKGMAESLWANERYPLLGQLLRIELVHNNAGAFSTSIGAWTWEVNVALTVMALLLAVAASPMLARFDAIAPHALGLVAGAATGNLASMATSPRGVPDFLAIAHGQGALVLNVADVAAYIGLALCARIVWSI